MQRLLLLLTFFYAGQRLPAQYKVRFAVKDLAEIKMDSIFIAGNFNNWNPAPDSKYKLETYDLTEKSILLNLPAGHYEYKYHRGDWLKVEMQWNGEDISNRRIDVTKDTVIHDKVAEWRDLFFKKKGLINTGETKEIENLKQQLILAKSDSSRISIMEGLGFLYEVLNVDSSLKYTQAALANARKHGYLWAEARVMASLSSVLRQQGKFVEAMDLLFKSLKIARENNLTYDIARAYRRLGIVYFDLENFPKSVAYLLQAAEVDEENANKKSAAIDHVSLGDAYEKMNKLDSAGFHVDIAFKQKDAFGLVGPDVYNINGSIQQKKGNYDQASSLYKQGLYLANKNNDLVTASKICAGIAAVFIKTNRSDSAIFYALKGFEYGQKVSYKKGIILTGNLLSDLYGPVQPAEALKYYRIAAAAKDSLFGINNIQAIQDLIAREEARQKELEDARISYRNKLKLYGLVAGLAGLVIIAFILYRNNRHKQKANVLLRGQKEQIEATLNELKSAQAQLIQSEKMASLGELTAGIAHEIQNPLNFVNNFSEVNKELVEEATLEIGNGNMEGVKYILSDIKDNSEKINHHGKRADAIVKGMLQHSRAGTSIKEPIDINKLADEYLRLAYQGLRAKDKSFNATLKTDFGEAIGNINVIPQDIGRVLLNLYNNAFYAVNEKKKTAADGYEPLVSVTSKRLGTPSGDGGKVIISVTDNGNGISKNIVDKIFQPFFTTKPTGQGTGLGLSLAYDIIKAHGGELKVESTEGEGTNFTIQLPIQ